MQKRILLYGILTVCLFWFIDCKKSNSSVPQPTLSVNAGIDQTVQLPLDSVMLTGTASANSDATLQYSWSQVSGPNSATIVSNTALSTRIRTLKTGTYNFQFKVVSSSGLTSSDTIAVIVKQQNPPTVNAGIDKIIQLPIDTVTLVGSAAGGAPGITIATYTWSQLSGPNNATIVSNSSSSTLLKDLQIGSYNFQLKAIDNFGLSVTDTVIVTVKNISQTTLSLQPAANPNEFYLSTTGSFGGAAILPAEYWTSGGTPLILRSLFKFDLSGIPNPTRIKIISAKLSLYSHPAPTDGNLIDANFGNNNALLIQRVTSSWDKATTTFQNQPSTSTSDQLIMPQTNQSKLDLINMDVTNMVQAMMLNGNYGFLLKLQNETVLYNSRLFCSSLYTDASKRPAITILYEYSY